ncbi:FMN-binding negative transcriptional regulator [Cellulophaga omnivescoria]|uniref:FMN-binding negative transcriptional regulator n=1 Tax=Cellulophaga omnivescoria TaxID=1888890 RepID=UPI0009877B5B|nr:FMN-binding negative transcriptional regulator [Cellulophaga omnivescoria]WBU88699.1 FMN-binding negative transcriptional regulator [Cellulophaga omnivescoria]
MYIPPSYQNNNTEEIKTFVKNNSFGILVNQTNGKPWATHIPLELQTKNEKDILVGHIAKANPQWHNFKDNPEVLCIFNGPHSYISSSWYKDEEVPTWNYIAVHIYGKITIVDKDTAMKGLNDLVNKYEQASECPLHLDNLSKSTLAQVNGIIAFEIEITDIQATYKLSQTREEDKPKIIEELEKRDAGSKEIAKHMKK